MAGFFTQKTRGAHLDEQKNTADKQTETMTTPDKVWVPLAQHMDLESQVLVAKGDTVFVGQKIGDCEHPFGTPVHASVSGTVLGISEIVMPNGSRTKVAEIEADKQQALHPEIKPPIVSDFDSFIKAVRASGMVGLGGAGFPTHIKLSPKNLEEVDTLIVNAAECEPYITSDYRAMIEESDLLLYGIEQILKWLKIKRCIIGMEDNKQKAADLLLEKYANKNDIDIAVLPTIYPQGAEKMLIHQVVGRIVPEGKLPADVGVIMLNVTTVIEIARYLKTGIPLVNKRLTIDGGAIKEPKNIKAPMGASIQDVIEFCGGHKAEARKILMGGPMMGMTVYDEIYPILKNNNAILVFNEEETFRYEETACINCGRCTVACPMKLMPMMLKKANERDDLEALNTYKMNLCIECGSCSYVCPSRQDLVQSHRVSKAKLRKEGKK